MLGKLSKLFSALWRKPSARRRIEKTPEIAAREQTWFRSKPGELRPVGLWRGKTGVFVPLAGKEDRSIVHTHTRPVIVPSHADFLHFLDGIRTGRARTHHLIGLDNGREAGRLSLRATRKFVDLAKHGGDDYYALLVKMHAHLMFEQGLRLGSQEYGAALVKWLCDNKFFKAKTSARKGYEYRGGEFVKKSVK